MRVMGALLFLSLSACSGSRHVRVPISAQERRALNEDFSGDGVEVMFAPEDLLGKGLAPVSRVGIAGLRFDADAVRWQAGGKPEAVPPEALISIRRPRPGRGIVVGVLTGLAVGMVAGFAIGAAVGSACPGDCGQPAQALSGAAVGLLLGPLLFGTIGAMTAADTVSFSK